MSAFSRRKLLAGAGALAAGAGGLAVASRLAARYGLVPPDSGGLYGPGETLNYAAHRLLVGDAPAREFSPSQISANPFAQNGPPKLEAYQRHQEAGFATWRLAVDGLVARPLSLSIDEIRSLPVSSQITQLMCEEGWSFIAEWTGATLSQVLEAAGILPEAKYVVYRSIEEGWWDSLDRAEALHPQTLVAYGFNGGDLPLGHGGPLRLRVPRQVGYKSVKYLVSLTATDSLKGFGDGQGAAGPAYGYAWYAGI